MKRILLTSLMVLIPVFAFATESEKSTETIEKKESTLVLNVRRIGLEWSKTDVNNADEYSDSPIAQLKANNQDFIKGISDIALEYKKDKFNWNNSLFAEYGRTKIKPYNDVSTTNENSDKILLSSDLSYACWETSGFNFGPTARVNYETEFTANGSVPRQNVVRSNAGLSLFNHKIIKDLYIVGVYEYDFTYSDEQVSKMAAELGWRLEYEVREGIKFSTNGYYREYFTYSHYTGTDLERDLSAVVRMDTNLWGDFTMGPYVQYRLAKSREADVYGSNFVMGISFSYITKFGLN